MRLDSNHPSPKFRNVVSYLNSMLRGRDRRSRRRKRAAALGFSVESLETRTLLSTDVLMVSSNVESCDTTPAIESYETTSSEETSDADSAYNEDPEYFIDPIEEEPIIFIDPIEEEPPLEEEPIEEEPIEDPVLEEPIVEEPVEEPVEEEPIVEEPIVEEPIVEEPIVEEPIVEEPIVEEPIVEEPIEEEPIVEEPVEDPVGEEPVEEPIIVNIDPWTDAMKAYLGDDLNGQDAPFAAIGFQLSLLHFEYLAHGMNFETNPEYLHLQDRLVGQQIYTQENMVLVDITVPEGTTTWEEDLLAIGALDPSAPTTGGNIWLPIDSLDDLSALTWVSDVDPFFQDFSSEVLKALDPYYIDYPDDPLFFDQWHLDNRGQSGGLVGEDANVLEVWDEYRGRGVTIGVIDSGVDVTHSDLADNYNSAISFDFADNDFDPTPNSPFESHGTSVAGVAAGDGFNFQGTTGAAPDATFGALRLITGGFLTDQQIGNALGWASQNIDIYNNSWGPGIDSIISPAGAFPIGSIENGVINGRGGLGNIYVFAGGNGQQIQANVNYSEFQNSRYTIAVAAIGHDGIQAEYSNPGAPLLISASSQGRIFRSDGITTTTVSGTGNVSGDYTDSFNGTSSSAPLVSGVIALMLEANPNLTWRDVQHILVNSARQNHAFDSDWTQNGAGRWVNHKYGYGAIDAGLAVQLAETWTNVGQEVSISSGEILVNERIEFIDPVFGVDQDVVSTFTFDGNNNITAESVEVVFHARADYRGDLAVNLISPDGTMSVLSEARITDPGVDYNTWTFTSMRHWGEQTAGTWTLQVSDQQSLTLTNTDSELVSWSINVHGTGQAPPQGLPPGVGQE